VPSEKPEKGKTPATLTPGQVAVSCQYYQLETLGVADRSGPNWVFSTDSPKSVASTHRIALQGAFLTDVFWRIAQAPCEQDTSPDVLSTTRLGTGGSPR
jgi:hypothetical protein